MSSTRTRFSVSGMILGGILGLCMIGPGISGADLPEDGAERVARIVGYLIGGVGLPALVGGVLCKPMRKAKT